MPRELPELKVRRSSSHSHNPCLALLTTAASRTQSRVPLYLGFAVIAASAWGLFLVYATNEERANSSVVRSLAFQLRSWPAVKEFLGDNVKIEPLIGEFVRIKGSVRRALPLCGAFWAQASLADP